MRIVEKMTRRTDSIYVLGAFGKQETKNLHFQRNYDILQAVICKTCVENEGF